MYVHGGARITRQIWNDRWSVAALFLLAVLTELCESRVTGTEFFSMVHVGVFSAALSIFLVFRFNEAYDRWWEARKLWGALTNTSRDFARQVLTLPAGERRSASDELVRRQIAFVHTLRIRLREGSSAAGRAQAEEELRRLLPEDAKRLVTSQNIPNTLLREQSDQVADLLRDSVADRILLTRLDTTLASLHEIQGSCERIKQTAFPDAVALLTRVLVWSLVVLLFVATLDPGDRGGVSATAAVCVMAMAYIWIESMGRSLKDPFECRPNDTPMTAISIAIERDLREMLGQTDLPEPLQPTDGVLM